MKVGIAGVGLMGHGIAANILKAGHQLWLLEHPGNQPVGDLLAAGATTVASGAELARAGEVVILCVTGSPQVREVLLGEGGVLSALQADQVVIDCSTAIPSESRAIAREVAARGGHFADAAMTRTPKEAAEGRLNLIVGAEEGLFARVRPLLACFAENIVHAGLPGAGHELKLIHNFVSLGFSAVLAEACACARRAGMDQGKFLQVLAEGGGGGVVLERMRPYIENRDKESFRFTIANAVKDMGYYRAMVDELGGPARAIAAVEGIYQAAAQAGIGDATVPELIDYLEEAVS